MNDEKDKTFFAVVLLVMFTAGLSVILIYNSSLNLKSDDQRYLQSAKILINEGILTYHEKNVPTVFITPIYPMFLGAVFKIFGQGLQGEQAARIIQLMLSIYSSVLVYKLSDAIFNNKKIALLGFAFSAVYIPNIVVPGFFLTETLFSFLLLLLLYYWIRNYDKLTHLKSAVFGVLCGITILCRPTSAMVPIIIYIFSIIKYRNYKMIKNVIISAAVLIIVLSSWWIRNYIVFKKFIPLTLSSGNPLLLGTKQNGLNLTKDPYEYIPYKSSKSVIDTDEIEKQAALKRIQYGFKNDFLNYLKAYTIGKTAALWGLPYYNKEVFGIKKADFRIVHAYYLLGFIGLIYASFKKQSESILILSIILYFNILFCIFFSYSRYSYPLIYLLDIYLGYFVYDTVSKVKHKM
jgi:4-amino-4-deoxy-L-arabinose transferase-like glycosyltransferase